MTLHRSRLALSITGLALLGMTATTSQAAATHPDEHANAPTPVHESPAEPPAGEPTTYTEYPAVEDPGVNDPDYFSPLWLDDQGQHIQAHGGQIVSLSAEELGVDPDSMTTTEEAGHTVYYWYGEDRSNDYYNSPGVHVYKSYDTKNWVDQGIALRSVSTAEDLTSDYFDALYDTLDATGEPRTAHIEELNYHLNTNEAAERTTIFERPKVLYNEQTDQWVMWWHSDGQQTPDGSMYERSMAGVAVSESPTGPFRLTGAYRLYNRADYKDCTSAAVPGQSRDMTVFKDSDGTAYIVYSSEENYSLYIAELNASYTNLEHTTDTDTLGVHQYSESGQYPYIFADGTAEAPVRGEDFQIVKECGHLEAPALFEHGGRYYAIASGATGWDPNPATYYTAEDILGDWIRGVEAEDEYENVAYDDIPEGGDGLLSVGDTRRTTFGSQSTNVLDLGGGRYVYMGDRWDSGAADSTYVWLPITIGENGQAQLRNPAAENPQRWGDGWDETYWDTHGAGSAIWRVTDAGVPERVAPGEDFGRLLPDEVPVEVGEDVRNVPVTWDTTSLETLGEHTITGTLAPDEDFTAGRTFTRTIEVWQEGVSNLARSAVVEASSRTDLAPRVIDGNIDGKGWDDWSGDGYPLDSWLQFTWPLGQQLDTVVLHTFKDGSGATWPSTISAQYLDEDGNWQAAGVAVDLEQDPSATAPVAQLDLSAVPRTAGLRLDLHTDTDTWQSISEVQIWGDSAGADLCSAPDTQVSASFHQTDWDTMPAAGACDGDGSTSWSTWDGDETVDEATFTVTPAQAHVLDHLALTNVEGTIRAIDIDYRDEAGTWHQTTAQGESTAPNGTVTSIEFDPVWASALRITFATPDSYLKIPTLTVTGQETGVEPAVTTRCVAGKTYLVATAQRTGSTATDVQIHTPYGSRTLAGLEPGSAASAAFAARLADVPAGSVEFAGSEGTVTAGYPGNSCS